MSKRSDVRALPPATGPAPLEACDVFHIDPARVAASARSAHRRAVGRCRSPRPSGRSAIPTRVRVLDALSHGELCVCDLATLLGLSQSATSHQLRLLRALRLVRSRRAGRMVFYTLDDRHIVTLFRQGLRHVEEAGRVAAEAAGVSTAARRGRRAPSARCTPSRCSASPAWTARKRRLILERRLTPLAGVDALSADVLGQKLRVSYDAAVLNAARIVDAVAETGMRAWLEHETPGRGTPSSRRDTWPLAVAGAAVVVGLALQQAVAADPRWAWPLVRRSPYCWPACSRPAKAWRSLRRRVARHPRADAGRGDRRARARRLGRGGHRRLALRACRSGSRCARWSGPARRSAR